MSMWLVFQLPPQLKHWTHIFFTDYFNDIDILRRMICCMLLNSHPENRTKKNSASSLLNPFLDEDSLDGSFYINDGVFRFARCSSSANRVWSPLDRWRYNNALFPTVVNQVRKLLAIQACLFVSGRTFSLPDNSIDEPWMELSNASICVILLLKSLMEIEIAF